MKRKWGTEGVRICALFAEDGKESLTAVKDQCEARNVTEVENHLVFAILLSVKH